jgi:serine/threonine-protein kinase RsbT
MISTAAAELSTNILRYAGKGELFLRIVGDTDRVGIEILAVDKGPGIYDVKKALEDSYTTTKGSLGLGLPSVRRIMDDFEIESSPVEGTRITARKWRTHGKG